MKPSSFPWAFGSKIHDPIPAIRFNVAEVADGVSTEGHKTRWHVLSQGNKKQISCINRKSWMKAVGFSFCSFRPVSMHPPKSKPCPVKTTGFTSSVFCNLLGFFKVDKQLELLGPDQVPLVGRGRSCAPSETIQNKVVRVSGCLMGVPIKGTTAQPPPVGR